MEIGKPLAALVSPSVPAGILDDAEIRFAGFTFRQPGYGLAVDRLVKAGYVDGSRPLPRGRKHPNLFSFAYDWRRDLPESAAKLHEFLLEKRRYLQELYEAEYGVRDYDVQFDLVAHSMGGLLARYYLMYGDQDLPHDPEKLPELDWRGCLMVDKLLVVGTPNDGYLDTFRELVEGLVLVRVRRGCRPAFWRLSRVTTRCCRGRRAERSPSSSAAARGLRPTTFSTRMRGSRTNGDSATRPTTVTGSS